MTTLPVFPLNALLMPGCRMPLQIFEKRYLDMVSQCMRTDSGFCVALLRAGSERHEVIRPGQAPATDAQPFYSLGTEARIVDFDRRDNGLLAITIQGGQRMALNGARQDVDGLWRAQAEPRPEQLDGDFGDHSEWTDLLNQLLEMSGMKAMGIQADAQHGEQVMNYLIMLLPLPAAVKQDLLETDSHAWRWRKLASTMAMLGSMNRGRSPN